MLLTLKSYIPTFFSISAIVLLAFSSSTGKAEEQTLNFRATVDIQKDGWILVSETIRIHAEGDKFKNGITRPIPVRFYSSESRQSRRTKVKILSAKIDGKELRYTTHLFNAENISFKFRSKDGPLEVPSDHLFEIQYKVGRWIDHLPTEDQLQWNLVGTLHQTPVKKARLTIRFPSDVPPEKLTVTAQIVGPYLRRPAEPNEYRQFFNDEGHLCFETTAPLAGNLSLKVYVGFPPGMVDPPSEETLRMEAWQANLTAWIALAGMIVLAVYYGLTWCLTKQASRIKDGSIQEESEVPCDQEGHPYSPAALRFLRQHEFDNRCFAATLMNLEAGKLLQMELLDGHTLSLRRGEEEPLPPLGLEEMLVCETLFLEDDSEAVNERVVDGKQLWQGKIVLQGAVESLNFGDRYFTEKRGCFDLGTILCFALFLLVPLAEMIYVPEAFALLFMSPFLLIGALALASAADRHFREWSTKTKDDKFAVAFAFTLFFLIGSVVTVCYGWLTTRWAVPMLIEIVFFVCFFQRRLKYPTKEGVTILERIEGFRSFLKRNLETDSNSLPRLRPYAFALDLVDEPELLKNLNEMLAVD